MSEKRGTIRCILPEPDPEVPGDLVPPWGLWLEGEIHYGELPPEDQYSARYLLAGVDACNQRPVGGETSVRFMPGDRFVGWEKGALIGKLVLSPGYSPVEIRSASQHSQLHIFINDEEVDVVQERGGMPLPPGVDIREHPIVHMSLDRGPVAATAWAVLYESTAWLMSVREAQSDRFLPILTSEMGEESEYRRTYEAWVWLIEMTQVWADSRLSGDLVITSRLLEEEQDPDDMKQYVSVAAEGGRGVVRFNGVVVYEVQPRA